MNKKLVEWSGALLGLCGSALLALNLSCAGYAFVAYLFSNVCWLAFGIKTRAWGLVTMQAGFTVTSLIGVYTWLLKPVASIAVS